jgi:large subunit ribosomal protein L29
MKAVEIRELSMQELTTKLNDLKSELFNLRFQLATGQLSNPVSMKNTKKDIARVATIIKERELKAKIADKKEVI